MMDMKEQKEIHWLQGNDIPAEAIELALLNGLIYKYRQTKEGRYNRGTCSGRVFNRSWDIYEAYFTGTAKFIGRTSRFYVLHHIDKNVTNDNFPNIRMMLKSKHSSLHRLGKQHSEETKDKISNVWTSKPLEERLKHSANISNSHTQRTSEQKQKTGDLISQKLNGRTHEAKKASLRKGSITKGHNPDEAEDFLTARQYDHEVFTIDEYATSKGITYNAAYKWLASQPEIKHYKYGKKFFWYYPPQNS